MRICISRAQDDVGNSRLNVGLIFWILTKASTEASLGALTYLNQIKVPEKSNLTTRTAARQGDSDLYRRTQGWSQLMVKAPGRDSNHQTNTTHYPFSTFFLLT